MKSFAISIAWVMLVLWCAIRIGFALQTIDPAVAFITDPSICHVAGSPVVNGHCRAEGRIVGGLDDKWHLHTASTPVEGVVLSKSVGLLYQVESYSFRGGSLAGYVLAVLTFILASLPAIFATLKVSRKAGTSSPKQSSQGV